MRVSNFSEWNRNVSATRAYVSVTTHTPLLHWVCSYSCCRCKLYMYQCYSKVPPVLKAYTLNYLKKKITKYFNFSSNIFFVLNVKHPELPNILWRSKGVTFVFDERNNWGWHPHTINYAFLSIIYTLIPQIGSILHIILILACVPIFMLPL